MATNADLVCLGPVGRPHTGTDAAKDAILEAIIEGKSLRAYCAEDGNPSRRTVLRWLDEDQDFAAKYAYAREMQADYMDDLILEAAESTKEDNAAAQRVKIAAYQWRASKLRPKRYGDKVQHEHSATLRPAHGADQLSPGIAWLAARLEKSGDGPKSDDGPMGEG